MTMMEQDRTGEWRHYWSKRVFTWPVTDEQRERAIEKYGGASLVG